MSDRTRDHTLDYLKGLGCLLMVFAHSAGVQSSLTNVLAGQNSPFVRTVYLAGEFAPVFFFAVAGVTAYLQAEKYGPQLMLVSYLLLFLLGFSYNGITERNFYAKPEMEIIQIIAVGTIAVYLIQRAFRPAPFVFLVIAVALFALKMLGDQVASGLLASPSGGSHWLTQAVRLAQGIIVPPGTFPLLPWLFLFFLGVFAYRARPAHNLAVVVGSAGLFVTLYALRVPLHPSNKWNMSVGNFLLSCSLLCGSFYLIKKSASLERVLRNVSRQPQWRVAPLVRRSITRISTAGRQLLLLWGIYSLLFLFVHKFVIRLLHHLPVWGGLTWTLPYVFWLFVILLSSLLLRLVLKLSSLGLAVRFFESIPAWVLLVCLIFLAPLLIANQTLAYLAELTLGIVFALFYPALRKVLRRSRPAPSRANFAGEEKWT